MIYVTNTPNNAGVTLHGDYLDLEELYEALHTVVGKEGQFLAYEAARIRVLGVCFDIRHALMGDREIELIDNGMDAEKMKRLSMITSGKNVYFKINVLWPEMLFVTMALNDFVKIYARIQSKNGYDMMMDKRNIWDNSIAQVRMFQVAIKKGIKDVVTEASFSRMMNMMNSSYTWVDGYITQYVDVLNIRFLAMDKEKRLKNIPTMAKRLTEQGDEYREVKEQILAAAKTYDCSSDYIRLKFKYPENIEW